jgi:hypothetical protein
MHTVQISIQLDAAQKSDQAKEPATYSNTQVIYRSANMSAVHSANLKQAIKRHFLSVQYFVNRHFSSLNHR